MLPDWEIWLDSHFSPILAKWLKDEFQLNIKSSYVLKTDGMDDIDIYHKAKAKGNVILLTKDSDFDNIISAHGAPPKLLNIKMGNCNNREMLQFLKSNLLHSLRLLTSFDNDMLDLE